jgi:hypothetical protein
MANQWGIDLGNALARAEEIKAARINNAFRPRQLEQGVELNDQAIVAGAQNNAMGAVNVTQAQRGEADTTALREARAKVIADPNHTEGLGDIGIIAPNELQGWTAEFAAQDERTRAKTLDNINQVGNLSAYVLSAEDPAKAYAEARKSMSPELQKLVPETFDQTWVEVQLAKATTLAQKAAQTQSLTKGAPANYMWTDETHTKLTPIPGGKADPANKPSSAVPVAVSNAIRATTVQLFGGTYDPQTGGFAGLDETQATRALDIMAAAEQLVVDKGLTPAIAVQQAFKDGGGKVPAAGADDGETIKVDENGNVIE